jgi:hypothetical protein
MKFNRETLCSNRSADGEWLLKKKSASIDQWASEMIDTQNKLSIVKQCRLLEFIEKEKKQESW